ncbi:hypothetical protein HBI73_119130 [Parastagonospora nodorum]|nr:hypothetical protein HBI10_158130 [Parastagonospora nodorum]KAH5096655.1 hypothetical protein HBH72_138270 [Parastagonospora nodorum]KAH5105254.1 hypothetical protein HBI73_119130 [Parastagonospora nodorum]KAH5301291.1 hypothetical protein HBI11_144100 [Parastagonospora nodorum]KAH6194046.1 hypothetical protein HBI15_232650 [Parastagonospora nodorum]
MRIGNGGGFGRVQPKRLKSGLLHGLTNDVTLIKLDESVGSSENQGGLGGYIGELREISVCTICASLGATLTKREASYTIDNQILTGQSTGLVEAGYVDLTSEGNAEWLGTEDGVFAEGSQTGVYGEGEFHGQLGWDNAGDDQDAVEEELVALAVELDTLLPDVPGSGHSEDGKEKDKEKRLDVVGGDALGCVDHGPNEAALVGLESGLDHDSDGALVRWRGDAR